MKKPGVTAAELEKAKRRSLSGHLSSLTTMRGKASDLGSNWLLTRNLNFSNEYLAAAPARDGGGYRSASCTPISYDNNLTISSLNPDRQL